MGSSHVEHRLHTLGHLGIGHQIQNDPAEDFSARRVSNLLYDGNITLFGTPRIALEDLVHPAQGSSFALGRRQHKAAANEQLVKFCAFASKLAKVRDTDHIMIIIIQAF